MSSELVRLGLLGASGERAGSTVPVEFRDHVIHVGDTTVPLLSGQVDYWLHPPAMWPRILGAVVDIGLPMVACYVPWNYHQIGEGHFDFTGVTDSTRALDRFLDLAADAGLWVFLRPGPWIYTFYMDGGVPMEASRYHRLDTRFLDQARRYFDALAPIIVPRLASHGGPIVLCQIDNEIEPLATQRGDSGGTVLPDDPVGISYADQILAGPLSDEATLRSFLARREGDVGAFARAHGLPVVASWDDLDLLALVRDPAEPIRLEVMDYYAWYCTRYAQVIDDMMRQVGFDVPTALNVFTNMEPQSDVEFDQIADVVGGDYWGMNHLPWETALYMSRHVRHLRCSVGTPWSAEFQSVSIAQFVIAGIEDFITPDNTTYLALLGMLCGLKGWNWYTIAERSSLYFAPINNFGGKIPGYFEPYAEIHRHFVELDWPSFSPMPDAAIWFDRANFRSEVDCAEGLDVPFNAITERGGGPWLAAFDRLHRLDIDLEIYDPEAAHNQSVTGRVVFVSTGSQMPAEAQRQLKALASVDGARLIFLTPPPTLDGDGQPTDLWSDLVAAGPGQTVEIGVGRAVVLGQSIRGPESRQPAADAALDRPIDGVAPGQADDDAELLVMMSTLGAFRTVWAGQAKVLSSVWSRGDERVIVVLNTTSDPVAGPLRLDLARLGLPPAPAYRVDYRLTGHSIRVGALDLASLPLTLPAFTGEIVRIRPVSS